MTRPSTIQWPLDKYRARMDHTHAHLILSTRPESRELSVGIYQVVIEGIHLFSTCYYTSVRMSKHQKLMHGGRFYNTHSLGPNHPNIPLWGIVDPPLGSLHCPNAAYKNFDENKKK